MLYAELNTRPPRPKPKDMAGVVECRKLVAQLKGSTMPQLQQTRLSLANPLVQASAPRPKAREQAIKTHDEKLSAGETPKKPTLQKTLIIRDFASI